ncbi:hypothetical protein PENTCL1PPCAC_16513, partial [Pristionchus entomophagus]
FRMVWRASCLLVLYLSSSLGVKRQDFKTCSQSAFCKTHRAISSSTGYSVNWPSIEKDANQFRAKLTDGQINLQLTITGLTEGRIRVQIDEPKETAIRQRYIPIQALAGEPEKLAFNSTSVEAEHVEIVNGDRQAKAVIHRSPFVIDLFNGEGELVTQINAGGKLKMDVFTTRRDAVQYPDGFWEEKFKKWTDTKSYGSSSVGVDITMVGFRYAYGLPEHADSFALKSTVGSTDPYRMFNTDVFEYEIGNPMTLYVSVPYLMAHRKEATAGMMWLNAAETWVDTQSTDHSKGLFRKMWNTVVPDESVPNFTAHFMSESGLVDVFFFAGPTPQKVQNQLAITTGVTPLPPLFSLGYHHSRWNFQSQDDVAKVNQGFDDHDIPMDVLWLDIEHTDGKKYFTWHPDNFKNPKEMIDRVAAKGRKMVTIIDPHIKKDPGYRVYKDAKVWELYVKRADNRTDFEGDCWPGTSEYLDFFKPKTREYWISQFAFDRYEGSTEHLFTWNDMNEPSVFSGPEVTMDRNAIHHGGMEHREVHNIYGLQYHSATFEGLLARTGGVDRPFLLSRSGFIGTQRTAAIWTGDNAAQWSHLEISAPMTLSLSIAGIPFVGGDVGGYFGNPSEEMLIRWYQVGSWQPFFRAHSHIDTRRREPWLYSDKAKESMRRCIRERYALLPYWYATFRDHAQHGHPPMRPIFYEFPKEEKHFETQEAWMIGSALLVHPVVSEGTTTVKVHLPENDGDKLARWFDYHTGASRAPGVHTIAAPLYDAPTPVWQRGGTIVPTWQRIRRSAWLMCADPITLLVALDANSEANGTVYMDDSKTHAYREGQQFVEATMEYKSTSSVTSTLNSKSVGKFEAKNRIEKIEIRGVHSAATSVTLKVDGEADQSLGGWKYDAKMQTLSIRKPSVLITRTYSIDITF